MKIRSIILSVVVTALMALLLLGSRMGFRTIAGVNAERELNEMLAAVLPGSNSFEWEDCEGEDPAIHAVYKGETGYVVETSADGYAGEIRMLVGVSKEGMVMGLVVRKLSETYGLGANALTDTTFLSQFLGTSGDAEVGNQVDAMTGATVSSKAVTRAVNAAVSYVTGADTASSATEWGG